MRQQKLTRRNRFHRPLSHHPVTHPRQQEAYLPIQPTHPNTTRHPSRQLSLRILHLNSHRSRCICPRIKQPTSSLPIQAILVTHNPDKWRDNIIRHQPLPSLPRLAGAGFRLQSLALSLYWYCSCSRAADSSTTWECTSPKCSTTMQPPLLRPN